MKWQLLYPHRNETSVMWERVRGAGNVPIAFSTATMLLSFRVADTTGVERNAWGCVLMILIVLAFQLARSHRKLVDSLRQRTAQSEFESAPRD